MVSPAVVSPAVVSPAVVSGTVMMLRTRSATMRYLVKFHPIRHTSAMRHLHSKLPARPASALLRFLAVLAAAGCLALAACSSSSSSHPASAAPAPAPTPAGEPTSGPAAIAAIRANWKTVFNGKAPLRRRLALLQDGSQVAAFAQAQATTSVGQTAAGSSATVSSVKITSPSRASVHYQVLLLGLPVLKNKTGTAVYISGVWKVGIASFCDLIEQEYPKNSPQLPAPCRA